MAAPKEAILRFNINGNQGMKERLIKVPEFVNDYCSFRPSNWVEVDGILRPMLYKVVTENLQSLGLRKNPNIITFTVGQWIELDNSEIIPGNIDRGGIWNALTIFGAKTLTKYMIEKYGIKTKSFTVAVKNPLYANSYRVKSQAVILLKELNL